MPNLPHPLAPSPKVRGGTLIWSLAYAASTPSEGILLLLFACPKSNQKRHHAQKLSNFAFALPTHYKSHAKFGVHTGRGLPTARKYFGNNSPFQ
jgi:hypothetical protein